MPQHAWMDAPSDQFRLKRLQFGGPSCVRWRRFKGTTTASAHVSSVHEGAGTANRRTSEDGLPLHSFSSLLQELATPSRHRCLMRSDPKGPLLIRLTDPTPLQKRAMELWRAFPVNNTPNPATTSL